MGSIYPDPKPTEDSYEYKCCDGQYYIILFQDPLYPDKLQIRLERWNDYYQIYGSLFTLTVPDLRTDTPPEIIADRIDELWPEKYDEFTIPLRNAVMQ